MINEWVVCILLECILVLYQMFKACSHGTIASAIFLLQLMVVWNTVKMFIHMG